tara:strand:+ start:375 stop:629 length:255 start_codon:yes stop_codon:yes gene_type:complete
MLTKISVSRTKVLNAEQKLQTFFEELLIWAEKSSKSHEDSILLAGAMMGVSRILYFEHLSKEEAKTIVEHNTYDFIDLIKPTIH